MSNPTPHIITPEQRGHRAPLSDEGLKTWTPSAMGKIGGKKSRRVLTPEEAHRIVMIREKQRARVAVNNAIKIGEIVRPTECSKCKSTIDVEAHHARGYKNPLDVDWLCHECHKSAHADDPRTGHRAPLSDEGPSVIYPLRVPESWHGALKRAGAEAVRKRLKPLVDRHAVE